MHTFFRLMADAGPETYTAEEAHKLKTLLASAPGVLLVKKVSHDPRGGYAVSLDIDRKLISTLIEYLASHGWRGGI
jgi:hypothetical protein